MSVDFIGELAGHSLTKPKRKKRFEGIAIGKVVANCDSAMQGRVQVRLDSAPDLALWAGVISPMAGSGYGFFAPPQIGDQVVVVFNHGDLNEPYIVGVVRKATDLPQITLPTEAVTKRKLRTPVGHEIDFDDATQALTITSSSQQKVSMNLDSVELTAGLGAATIQMTTGGAITITGATSIELNAPTITLNGTVVEMKAVASATLNGGASCTVKGAVVSIN
jgi:uncharacterized protein involved in type VI secretion and phage assembly